MGGAKELRDSLRRLCAEVGWSYAVFWKAVRGDDAQLQLVWGDGHCERMAGAPAISGFEAMDLLLKEKAAALRSAGGPSRSEAHASEGVVGRAEDRVDTLVNKLMVHQVHVVGEGAIGQAALTGVDRWMFYDNIDACGSVGKALPEMKQQIWGGIQTVAIIPVLPHGVIQLGSTKIVMEDAALINHVRSLFAQLTGGTGVLTPSASLEDSILKTLIHNSFRMPTSVSRSGDVPSSISASAFTGDRVNHNHLGFQMSSFVLQPSSHPMPQICAGIEYFCSTVSTQSSSSLASHSDFFQPMVHIDHGANILFNNQLDGEQLTVQLKINGSDIGSRNDGSSNISNFPKESNMAVLNRRNCLSTEQRGCPPGGSMEITKSENGASHCIGEPQVSDTVDTSTTKLHSADCQLSNAVSVNKKFQRMSIADHTKHDDNSFATLDVPFIESDQYSTYFQSLLGTLQSGSSSNSNAIHQDSSQNVVSGENSFCSLEIKKGSNENDLPELLKLPISSQLAGGNDLFDVLRFQHKPKGLNSSEVNAPESVSACATGQDIKPFIGSLNDDLNGLISENSPDQLLDAIVLKINSGCRQNLDTSVSGDTSTAKVDSPSLQTGSHPYSLGSSSGQVFCNLVGPAPVSVKTEIPTSSFAHSSSSMDKSEGCSWRQQSYKSQISLWVENSQSAASDSISAGPSKMIDEVGKSNRKRARPGENPRPRPKDRQMIQDRIKELREIVPNGAKCSIDALLEKTIKHMVFLQSVAKHADKLKEAAEPKIISQEGGLLLKDNFEGGATWAFEVGTQSMTCPIIVEDLNPPRQMLVEMLCKERGIFLEIADQIRSLGLTILKGVMEVRKDKIWARFAVEANKDVTRMEIFLSLVHLLEPAARSSMLPAGVENISLRNHGFYPSSIPATGFSDCLR